jgi:hypothetical protein
MQLVLCMAGQLYVFLNAQYIETCNGSFHFPLLLSSFLIYYIYYFEGKIKINAFLRNFGATCYYETSGNMLLRNVE